MSESTAICQVCCNPPAVAFYASQYTDNQQNLAEYGYVSTFQATTGKPYQFKSQRERLLYIQGKVANPQAIALRRNGGQC